VADFTTSIMARTFGAHTTAGTGARAFSNPWYAISSIGSFPYDGSAVVWWDAGTPASPLENVPNRAGEDPHGAPRSEVAARLQKSEFSGSAAR
jgi:hypothetical protein